jgi:hypothetical protein
MTAATLTTYTRDLARFLQSYAKQYHAGAFATPTAKELAANPGSYLDLGGGGWRVVLVRKRLTRDSTRLDYTGRPYILPAGATIVTHIARTPGAPMPDFEPFDFVMAYAEDHELTRQLQSQRREVYASRVSAAAEVINCWGRAGSRQPYPAYDRATVVEVPVPIGPEQRAAILDEAFSVTGWDDDFPYYSDGSWSAVSLKGFYPDEPGKGVKPSEMPKSWKAEHPDDLNLTCQWTTLAERCPSIMELVLGVDWWARTERVRLLRMDAGGTLGRHTDITDRDGGTRDGQITRFHIPLVTDPSIELLTWDVDGVARRQHLAAWRCYYLDARKPHSVVNPSGVSRIHLVVDAVSDGAVRDAISAAL